MLKFLFAAGTLILALMSLAVFGTLFLYCGWNYGLVEATPTTFTPISFATAWWLSVFFSTIGGFFKSELKVSN